MGKEARKVRKGIDTRDWREYNRWQSEEVFLACQSMKALVESATIHDWQRKNGRPRIPRRELVLCLLIRAYFDLSFRRTVGLLKLLQPALGLTKVPHFNTLQKYNRRGGLTATLQSLFDQTAEPFWIVEKVVSVDSTGLLLHGSGAWRSNKDEKTPRDFAKLHVLSGTKTRATLAIRVTRGAWHDSTQLEPLLEQIPDDAVAERLTADSAYWSHKGCAQVERAGLQPMIKPKENARWWTRPTDAFERMTRFAKQFPNRFKKLYHRRSTSESRNATEKGLFGDRLRTRRPASRRNDALAREIVYNVRLLTKGVPQPSAG